MTVESDDSISPAYQPSWIGNNGSGFLKSPTNTIHGRAVKDTFGLADA